MIKELKDIRDALVEHHGFHMVENSYAYPRSRTYNMTIEALSTLDSIMANSGWRDISTAPKDVKILMGVWFNGVWYNDVGMQFGKQGRRTICTGFRKNEFPTHWHPLPAAPKHGGEV